MAATATRRERTARPKTPRPSKASTRPTEDEIRLLAYHLYQHRRDAGIAGDPASDWIEAERQLSGRRVS